MKLFKTIVFLNFLFSVLIASADQAKVSEDVEVSDEVFELDNQESPEVKLQKRDQEYRNCGFRARDQGLGITFGAGAIPVAVVMGLLFWCAGEILQAHLHHRYPIPLLPNVQPERRGSTETTESGLTVVELTSSE